jgi:hypothetical protein
MKTICLAVTVLTFCLFSLAVSAQTATVLTAYYGVKDALVATDAAKAKNQATVLVAALNDIAVGKLAAADKKALTAAQTIALAISKATDVAIQRDLFAALSNSMIALTRATKPAKAYVQYCPMVNASWLSDKKEVRNPYYGDKMLTCGSVKEEI